MQHVGRRHHRQFFAGATLNCSPQHCQLHRFCGSQFARGPPALWIFVKCSNTSPAVGRLFWTRSRKTRPLVRGPPQPIRNFLSCINKIFIVCNHSAVPAKSYSLLSLMHSTPPHCSTFHRKLHRLASYRLCSLGLPHDALPVTLTCVRRRYWPPRSFPHRNFLVRDILCRGVV